MYGHTITVAEGGLVEAIHKLVRDAPKLTKTKQTKKKKLIYWDY